MDNGDGIAVDWLEHPIFRDKEGLELFVWCMPTFFETFLIVERYVRLFCSLVSPAELLRHVRYQSKFNDEENCWAWLFSLVNIIYHSILGLKSYFKKKKKAHEITC